MYYLLLGCLLGVSAGLAPGPLLVIVISETLQHGLKAGLQVALAPLLTDLPIIIVTVYLLAKLVDFHFVLGVISLLGGIVILYMGCRNILGGGLVLEKADQGPGSLYTGVFVNALSPHPYLFWFSVGAPIVVKASQYGWAAPVTFISGFYIMLVGSKMLLAVLAGKSKAFLRGKAYINTMRILGMALCVLAVLLFYDGAKLMGVI